jgi:4a-hydroxytetrahydrobiopterin dehydratase
MDHHPDIDLRWTTVTCTFRTHSAAGVTQLDVELAHRVLEQARAVGAEPAPPPGRVEVALDCADPDAVRRFWRVALGYAEQASRRGGTELRDPTGRGPVLWFQRSDPAARPAVQRFHLDVYVPEEDAPDRVRACVQAGGTLTDDSHAPSWWVLSDPEGNHVCVCTK